MTLVKTPSDTVAAKRHHNLHASPTNSIRSTLSLHSTPTMLLFTLGMHNTEGSTPCHQSHSIKSRASSTARCIPSSTHASVQLPTISSALMLWSLSATNYQPGANPMRELSHFEHIAAYYRHKMSTTTNVWHVSYHRFSWMNYLQLSAQGYISH